MRIENVQGDVIFKRIDSLPDGPRGEVPQDLKEGILAYGEVTGYRHQLMDETAFEAMVILGKVYLNVTKPVMLQHGQGKQLDKTVEHQSQKIMPGIYEIGGQVETDWISRTVRRVAD